MQNVKGLGTSLGRESIDFHAILRDGMMAQALLPVQPPHFTDAYTEAPHELMSVRQELGFGPLSSVLRRICVDLPAPCHAVLSHSVQFSSVAQLCPTLFDPMNHSTPGLPVHHQLPNPNPCPSSR